VSTLTAPSPVASPPADRADALAERLFDAAIGTLELFAIHVGRRLGLYDVLADGQPRNVAAFAAEAAIAERYAREWLEQQAVAGFLDVEGDGRSATERLYRLGPDHARVLADADDAAHVAPFGSMVAGIGQALPHVVAAYRTGDGVPYARYGSDFRDGQGGINRPAFQVDLIASWLPAIHDVHRRLQAGARVADIGCGQGWSTQALAKAYPTSRVVGIDLDEASIEDAERLLPAELHGQVRFVAADATSADAAGPFDVVLLLETLHDIGDPARALAGIRTALADGGTVIIVDERVAETFIAPGDPVERMMYGWSAVHCLPAAVADGGHQAIGTALRPATVAALAEEAGFAHCGVLPIEHDLFRFYRLDG
jgi:2-polyprenyl-3-methyl-5-hydroxy-6-metoxy-1,4-benzoquinol methylase